ncbi:phage tail protein [Idiomarina aminovorans]|uniref:phage tail protein n=1 Tax=Idiomarina aminovorans TaxID=2914829 RepID=UPI002003D269|nr:phage tail protein [Idiomarina sp. ATCH4]MCK7458510.1 phage tail protein [Idiomarina sp. ATCH4]
MPPAIAAVAVGVAAGVAASSVVVGIAVAIGTVALQNSLNPDMPGVDESAREAQTLTTEPLQPRRGIYGETVLSGSIVGYGKRKMGDKEAHVVAVTLAGHNIESAELYEVNGKPKPSGTTTEVFLGDQTAASSTLLQYADGWTEDHIGFGVSYAVVTIPIDPEEMPSGLQNITFKAKGKRVYDPRKDTTVGGSGSHRASDDATWEWSDNSILCALDYQRFHGYKTLGLNKFDLAHIMEQANICDELVSYTDADGEEQTEKRFTCNGSWTFDQSPSRVLERLMSSCGGQPYRRGGKMYLQTASYHGMAEITLTDTDAAGEITITPHRELKDRTNTVRASFQDPKKGYQPTDAPVVTNNIYVDRDGMELEDELQLNFTNSSTRAQRLMKYHLERNRAGMRLEFPCKSKGLLALAGTTVRVDLPNEGIDKEFIVSDWQFDFKAKKTKLILEEESPELYSDSLVPSEGNVTPNTDLPDLTRPELPESLSFTLDPISTHRQGYVTWSHPTPRAVTEYRVLVRKDGDDIIEYPVIARSGVQLKQDINGLDAGQYSIEVYARNRYDRTSVPASISLTLNEPSPPTSLGATAGNWEITLAPELAGIGLGTMFEFAYGEPDNIIGRGASVVIPGLTPETEHEVYARTVNVLGNSAWVNETVTTTKDTSQVDPIIDQYTSRLSEVETDFQRFVEEDYADLQQLVNANAQEMQVRFSSELFAREESDAAILSGILQSAASRDEMRRRVDYSMELIDAAIEVNAETGEITSRAFAYTDERFTQAQQNIDGVEGKVQTAVERISYAEEQVENLNSEILLVPGLIEQKATAIVSNSIAALEPAHAFNFFDSAQGWGAVIGTITPGNNKVSLTTGDIENQSLNYNGSEYPVVRLKVRRTAGDGWLGNIVVTFTDDTTQTYQGIIEPVEQLDTDVVRIVDFTALESYQGNIKGLRITLGQTTADEFELSSLNIGKSDAALQDLTNIQAQVTEANSQISALEGQIQDRVTVTTYEESAVTRSNVESVLDGLESYASIKAVYQSVDENGVINKANEAAIFLDGAEGTFTSFVSSLNEELDERDNVIDQKLTNLEQTFDPDGTIRTQAFGISMAREIADETAIEELKNTLDGGLVRLGELDKDARFALALNQLQIDVSEEGSLAKSIDQLNSFTQQAGEQIEAQSSRISQAETDINGYARALQILSSRVGSSENFAQAQLSLNTQYNEQLQQFEARAFLGVEQVQNGRAVLTGVTFGGSTNAVSFRGDVYQWEDTTGELILHYDTDEDTAYFRGRLVLADGFTVTSEEDIRGLDGEAGTPGAGMYGQSYDTISWTTSTANSRFTALVGRAPVPLDVFTQTLTNGQGSQARQYDGASWVQPTLLVNGSLLATGSVAGEVLIAGTELNSPVIKSGQIQLVGNGYMSIQTATPFGPNNLLEWKGPRNSYTYDEANKLVKFDGLTKANAIGYFSDEGDSYFGGSITAGTLKNAVQSTQLGTADVTVGPFGSNGGIIEIKCSISVASSTGLVSGNCPYPAPANPTGTLKLYRETAGGDILVATESVSGSYNCFEEGPEKIETWNLSGSFTYTDNLQTTSSRTYRLEVIHSTPIYINTNQRLSLITEEA